MPKLAMEQILSSKDFAILGLAKDDVLKAIDTARQLKMMSVSKPITKEDFLLRVKAKIGDLENGRDFTIFGTSGIRGKVEDIRENAVTTYKSRQIMSYKFAYLYGKAYGAMLNDFSIKVRDQGVIREVALGMDSRNHSLPMAACLMEGLSEQGIDVNFLGVAPTPCGNLFGNSIIITASHNPADQDGIKAFIEKRPITLEMEKIVESVLRVFEDLESEKGAYSSAKTEGQVRNGASMARKLYETEINHSLSEAGLVGGNREQRLCGTITPLDLAYGAAAAYYTTDGQFVLSPQISALLETGTAIVGYGILRDGSRTNYGIGAAYIYGETAEQVKPGEVGHFARGEYGYGQTREGTAHSRSFVFGKSYQWDSPSLQKLGLALPGGETVFLNVDGQGYLAGQLEKEVSKLTILPACSVDCDEDRYLATDGDLSKSSIPYLSGDTTIALFSHFFKNKINKVLFTVESGMALQKVLEKDKQDYDIVTVGDRAIADWIYDCDDSVLPAGGEPSGHVIFKGGKDDPVYTHILLLSILLKQNRPLAQTKLVDLVDKATAGIKEVYTDRSGARPKSPGVDGITLQEKKLLELRETGKDGRCYLTDYAKAYAPWCADLFSRAWKDLFAPGQQVQVTLSSEFDSFVKNGLLPPAPYGFVPVAEICIGSTRLLAKLKVSSVSYFGPSDITVVFDESSNGKMQVCGEMVSRNSGTSPKNSCYIKMWPHSASLNKDVDLELLEKKLKEMGQARVNYTSQYILERRGQDAP